MIKLIYFIYNRLFARRSFYRYNKLLYNMSLRGLGILNYQNDKVSGEKLFLRRFREVTKGVVLDIGANIGLYSKTLYEVNNSLRIYCFEPHPLTFLELQKNLKYDVTSINAAVGNEKGTVKLYDYAQEKDSSTHASLYRDVIEKIHKGSVCEYNIRSIKLDDFCRENNIQQIDLLKIDVEGHELEVLKGFENYIRQNKVNMIHFEFNEMNVISRVFFRDFWDFLPEYEFYRMLPDGLIHIEAYDPLFCEIFAFQNIVAIRKGSK